MRRGEQHLHRSAEDSQGRVGVGDYWSRTNSRLKSQQRYRSERAEGYRLLGGKCVTCGFSDRRALQFDHIRSNGWELRKANRRSAEGHGFVRHQAIVAAIRDRTIRDEYQLLCANCNQIKRHEHREWEPGIARSGGKSNGSVTPESKQLVLDLKTHGSG